MRKRRPASQGLLHHRRQRLRLLASIQAQKPIYRGASHLSSHPRRKGRTPSLNNHSTIKGTRPWAGAPNNLSNRFNFRSNAFSLHVARPSAITNCQMPFYRATCSPSPLRTRRWLDKRSFPNTNTSETPLFPLWRFTQKGPHNRAGLSTTSTSKQAQALKIASLRRRH